MLNDFTALAGATIGLAISSSAFALDWMQNPSNGNWYAKSSQVSYWQTAQNEAKAYGGNLVTIRNAQEQQWLTSNFAQPQKGFWIGMHQQPGATEPAGGWNWVSGEPTAYTNWLPYSGAPNDSGSWDGTGRQENVGIMLDTGHWEDYSDQPYTYQGQPQLDHARGIIEVQSFGGLTYADRLTSTTQLAIQSQPATNMLGAPDGQFTGFTNSPGQTGYGTVGLTGDRRVLNKPGDDIVVMMRDWNNFEAFDLYASQNGTDFVKVGSSGPGDYPDTIGPAPAERLFTRSFDLEDAGLAYAKEVRIQNALPRGVYNGFEGPDLDAVGFRGTFTTPPAVARPAPTPVPSTGKKNLVFITHGINGFPFPDPEAQRAWITQMKSSIEKDLFDRGLSETWAVEAYAWTEDAGSSIDDLPSFSLAKATMIHGPSVGKQIAAAGYQHVHFIAHSAGSGLIGAAAEWAKADAGKLGHSLTVHSTFLDPYMGPVMDWSTTRTLYGEASDYAENYFTHDFITNIFTQPQLPYAHNVDVTLLDPERTPVWSDLDGDGSMEIVGYRSTHGWPVDLYMQSTNSSVEGMGNYGYLRSLEGGGADAWADSLELPRGNDPIVLPSGVNDVATAYTIELASTISLADRPAITSETGTIVVTGTTLQMGTGSPVWFSTDVALSEEANFVTFTADFLSEAGAEGLLAVYWDDVAIGLLDERYVGDGVQTYVFDLPETYGPGDYWLAFRLDPYTEVQSLVSIDSVQPGFVAVPEPASLAVLTLGAVALLRRHRRTR